MNYKIFLYFLLLIILSACDNRQEEISALKDSLDRKSKEFNSTTKELGKKIQDMEKNDEKNKSDTNKVIEFFFKTGSVFVFRKCGKNSFDDKYYIFVENKMGDTIYRSKEFITYNNVYETDLNNDGKKELIFDVSRFLNSYSFNYFVVFDFTKSEQPIWEACGGFLCIDTLNGSQRIKYTERIISCAEYNIWFKYKNGKIISDEKVGNYLSKNKDNLIDDSNIMFLESCDKEAFNYLCSAKELSFVYNLIEAIYIQNKLFGNDKSSLKYFRRKIDCKNKENIFKEIIKSSCKVIEEIKNGKFIDVRTKDY